MVRESPGHPMACHRSPFERRAGRKICARLVQCLSHSAHRTPVFLKDGGCMTDLHQKMFVTMSSLLFLVIVLAWIERAGAHEQNQEWTLTLQPDGQPPAPYGLTGQQGTVRIAVEDDGSALNFALSGLRPRSVHGVWL